MNNLVILADPTVKYQRQIVNLPVGNITKRVIFETRYLEATDKWYISIFDANSGASICTFIPVIASYEYPINLFEPFRHKRIGWIVCVAIVDEPSSENPSKDNMGEFGFYWGDVYESEDS